jgi:hypothetical protein
MNFPVSIPACLFIGAMLILLAVVYFWFERGGASYSLRKETWRDMHRRTPRLSPKVEDDERRLKNLEAPSDPTQEQGLVEKL